MDEFHKCCILKGSNQMSTNTVNVGEGAAPLAKQDKILLQGQYNCRQSDECRISHCHICRAGDYVLTIVQF